MNDARTVLLASGGLDSTTLAYWLVDQGICFIPLFINYGQHCVTTELKTLKQVIPFEYRDLIQVVNISDIYKGCNSRLIKEPNLWEDSMEGDQLYLPYRNLLLLSVGAAFAQSRGYSHLYAGFINSNHAKEIDCSSKFFYELNLLLSEYGSIKIEMPFREMTKLEVARIGMNLNVPIASTFSCQAASEIPCGACPNCVDRLEALRNL